MLVTLSTVNDPFCGTKQNLNKKKNYCGIIMRNLYFPPLAMFFSYKHSLPPQSVFLCTFRWYISKTMKNETMCPRFVNVRMKLLHQNASAPIWAQPRNERDKEKVWWKCVIKKRWQKNNKNWCKVFHTHTHLNVVRWTINVKRRCDRLSDEDSWAATSGVIASQNLF